MFKKTLILTGILIGMLLSIPTTSAYLDQYASIGSSEWQTDIDPAQTSPDYDETPESSIACGNRSQEHIYYHQTYDAGDYSYWTNVHAFAMVLDYDYDNNDNPSTNDFLTNVDTENMMCTLGGSGWENCGFDKDTTSSSTPIATSSEWGGTDLYYQTLGFLPGSPKGLVWKYSEGDGNKENVPWLNRPSVLDDPAALNELISFGLEEYDEINTATTTAYALVEHQYYDYSDGDWNYLYTNQADPDDDGDSEFDPDGDYLYWYGMTAVLRSIFDDCECDDLDITSPTEISAEDAEGVITITIETEEDYDEGEFEYTSDGSCKFRSSYGSSGGSTTLTTSNTTVYAHSCTPGDEIFVEDVNYPTACNDSIPIADACYELEITDPASITVEDVDSGSVEIEITVTAESSGTWDGTYIYSSDNPSAWFFRNRTDSGGTSGSNPYETNDESVFYYNGSADDVIEVYEVDYPTACEDEITVDSLYCATASISPTSVSAEDAETYFAVTITDEDQIGTDWAGEYAVSSSDNSCRFTESETDAQSETGGTRGLTTSASTIYAYNCNADQTVSIEETTYSSACNGTVTIGGTYCGDGNVDSPNSDGEYEECDDGNTIDGDGCDSTCTVELYCESTTVDPTTLTAEEAADVFTIDLTSLDQLSGDWDGTYTLTSDGTCEFATTNRSATNQTGSNPLNTGLESVWGYGCSADEVITIEEINYPAACNAEIVVGATYCGDGNVDSPNSDGVYEECDDGNSVDDDSCSNTCEIPETNYCGDGEIQEPNDDGVYEECDDGNNTDADGCDANCQDEGTEACHDLNIVSPDEITVEDLDEPYFQLSIESTYESTDNTEYTPTTDGPNLFIEEISLINTDQVSVAVKNNGNGNVPSDEQSGHTYIYIDGTIWKTYSWTTLADTDFFTAGEDSSFITTGIFEGYEDGVEIEVCVDPNDVVNESNEHDNCKTAIFNEDSWDGTYTYTSDGTCQFAVTEIEAMSNVGSNPLETRSKQVFVWGCGENETITVYENDYQNICTDSITTQSENACDSLSISSPTEITVEELTEATEISIEVLDEDGLAWEGDYYYTSRNLTCNFETDQGVLESGLGVPTLQTSNKSVYAMDCSEGEDIIVMAVDYPAACLDELPVDSDLVCSALEITSPTEISVEDAAGVITLEIAVEDQNTDTWDGYYVYTSDDLSCLFDTDLGSIEGGGGNASILTATTTVYAASCNEGATIQVYESDYEQACNDEITIDTSGNYCGDGIVQYPNDNNEFEECDDGDLNGDITQSYCSETCTTVACVSLEIDPRTTTEFENTVFTITADPDGWPGGWNWTTTNPDGEFVADSGLTVGNTITTSDLSVSYSGAAEDTITVVEATNYGDVCNATVTIEDVSYCGDGTIDEGEECEPTGTVTDDNPYGDVCNEFCAIPNVCGDGVVDSPNDAGVNEECDDGNSVDDDSCSNSCTTTTETNFCGDGEVQSPNDNGQYEECDDGNSTDGDGCESCLPPCEGDCGGGGGGGGGGGNTYCGDGKLQDDPPNDYGTYEECDDGNSINDDGCSNVCQLEAPACEDLDVLVDHNGTEYDDGDTIEDVEDGDTITISIDSTTDNYGDDWENEDAEEDEDEEYLYVWEATAGTFSYEDEDGTEYTDVTEIESYDPELEVTYTSDGSEGEIYIYVDPDNDRDDDCFETIYIEILDETERTDELTKLVQTYNFGWMNAGSSLNGLCFINGGTTECGDTYAHDLDYGFYQVKYTPDMDNVSEITITDTIADSSGLIGQIVDETLETLIDDAGATFDVGSIDFYHANTGDFDEVRDWVGDAYGEDGIIDEMKVEYEDGTLIYECTGGTETCFDGSIGDPAGITLQNLDNAPVANGDILIKYLGQVDNGDFQCNNEYVEQSECPVHAYTNTATAFISDASEADALSASTDITIVCPYLLTRGAGDVYIEGDLSTVDLSCYDNYADSRNSDGLVLSRWGTVDAACNSSSNNEIISRFSSYVCEIITDVETIWEKTVIQSRVATENVEAITRNEEDLLSNLTTYNDGDGDYVQLLDFESSLDQLDQFRTNTSQNVYTVEGKDLHIGDGTQDVTVPGGAYTFIVKDADLIINSDILYPTLTVNDLTSPKEIPSIAFIVLGGNVHITNVPGSIELEEIVGVYFIQESAENPGDIDGDGIKDSGVMKGDWTDPFHTLTIYGSVYGDINSLLEVRTFAGPADYDHGNVVLRYDERIFLNTPPGLEDYIDIYAESTVR
jgi:cysteine-rich repeat protein